MLPRENLHGYQLSRSCSERDPTDRKTCCRETDRRNPPDRGALLFSRCRQPLLKLGRLFQRRVFLLISFRESLGACTRCSADVLRFAGAVTQVATLHLDAHTDVADQLSAVTCCSPMKQLIIKLGSRQLGTRDLAIRVASGRAGQS